MVTYRVLGTNTPRVDGADKVTGRARYAADYAPPGTLFGKVLLSPYASARIVRVDATEARKVPGVHALLTGRDVHGLYGRLVRDIPVLAVDRVRFAGERVAAVAAEDDDIAQQALDLIEVEYEETPAVFEPEEAMASGAPILHPDYNSYAGVAQPLASPSNVYNHQVTDRGDIEAGFAAAELIFDHVYTTQRVHQAYLEPQNVLVSIEPDRVHVWACSKAPYNLRDQLAAAVGISPASIVLNPVAIGGDFGGKGAPFDLPICYELAKASGRPVLMTPDYIEEFMAGNPRHATHIRLRTGVMKDGTLVAHHVRFTVNCGAYSGFKPRAVIGGATQAVGPYKIANVRVESMHVYTNTVPGGHMRAPGEPQGVFALESHLDEIARALGIDPLELLLKNVVGPGEATAMGARYEGIRAKETLTAAAEAAGLAAPKPTYVGRGIALGNRGPGGGQGNAAVTLKPDGGIVLGTPIFDQGTGTYTTLRQVVAEELQVAPERVAIEVWDTDGVEFDSGIGGARGTRVNSAVAYEAAQNAKGELLRFAAERLGWPAENLVLRGDEVRRTDIEEAVPWRRLLSDAGESITGRAHVEEAGAGVTAFAAQVAEVSVDPETGEVKILQFTTAHDVGRILNPVGHQGQINGGVMQGIGFAMMEELQLEDGRVTTLSFGDYKIPSMRDIPPLRTVLLEAEGGVGPYQIKGIGESPIGPVAPAIANAIEDAIGVRIRDLPITAEKVYRALKAKGA